MANNHDNKKVDEMGIRLAPSPMKREDANKLPSVQQDFVLRPVLEIDEPESPDAIKPEVSTVDDYQPKKKDVDKRYKRKKRSRNIVCGLVMFIVSGIVLVPFILAAVGQTLTFVPFKYVPAEYNVIGNLIEGIKWISAHGWTTAECAVVWKLMLPDYILALGLIFIAVNLVKSVLGICGAIKVKRYLACSIFYALSIVAVFIAALVGASEVGIAKIDFMNDIVKGWQSSDFVGMFIIAVGNIIVSALCSFINPERSGYTK